jgi:hypothetical protein
MVLLDPPEGFIASLRVRSAYLVRRLTGIGTELAS